MPIKREREESSELSSQRSASPEAKRIKVEVYELDFGLYEGHGLDEIPEYYLAELADDDKLV